MKKYYCFLSYHYWKKNLKQLFNVAVIITVAAAGLLCSAFLVLSGKLEYLDETLDKCGDYDWAVYQVDQSLQELITGSGLVERCGSYLELGYARQGEGDAYRVAAYESKTGEELMHLTCFSGRYPENEDEVAMDITAARAMGIPPVIGEKLQLTICDNSNQLVSEKTFTLCGLFKEADSSLAAGYVRYPWDQYGVMDYEYEVPLIYTVGLSMGVILFCYQIKEQIK